MGQITQFITLDMEGIAVTDFNIIWLTAEDISEVTSIHVSKTWVDRRKKALLTNKHKKVKVRVEKDIATGYFWLIDGFDEFKAYESLNKDYTIPCFVSENTSHLNRLLSILQYLVMTPNSQTIDKHNCITMIFELFDKQKEAYRVIENDTGLSKKEIKSFLFHPNIPDEIKTDENIKRLKLLNEIQKLSTYGVTKEVRDFLSYYAVQESKNRLTYDQLDVIRWMITKTNGFNDLPTERQIFLLPFAYQFEKLLIMQFQYYIDAADENEFYKKFHLNGKVFAQKNETNPLFPH
ncbi:hypothetical protein [Halalkalibacter urbisdiaboli]|uniref:hypothetical protein n=1 Tax=Halalkalibacter urbisdiaboli TaxID=1960589 RepID=UPI001054185E|nr:hypothetical protein [Halalkalibacter urbisdiaboli]